MGGFLMMSGKFLENKCGCFSKIYKFNEFAVFKHQIICHYVDGFWFWIDELQILNVHVICLYLTPEYIILDNLRGFFDNQ